MPQSIEYFSYMIGFAIGYFWLVYSSVVLDNKLKSKFFSLF